MARDIIQDLLAIPLEERAKVFEKAPQMRDTVENFLSQTSDFASLPDAEKVALELISVYHLLQKLALLVKPVVQISCVKLHKFLLAKLRKDMLKN